MSRAFKISTTQHLRTTDHFLDSLELFDYTGTGSTTVRRGGKVRGMIRAREAIWPYAWHAGRDGERLTIDGTPAELFVVNCGDLNVPSGKLIACDPFAFMMGAGRDPWVPIPPGRYPVQVTIADLSPNGDRSHTREAYASLQLSSRPEVVRRNLCALRSGDEPAELGEGEYWGFGVDAGTACFADQHSIERDMPEPTTWYDDLFESGSPDSWFARMDDPGHIRDGLANIPLPLGDGSTNIIIFHSGWGDGFYPVVGGYDDTDTLVAVHIDFFVVGSLED